MTQRTPGAGNGSTPSSTGDGTTGDRARLRPIERCVLSLGERGFPDDEIGRRLHRSAGYADRVRRWAEVPRSGTRHAEQPLRPIERCILRWRERGEDYIDVAARFHRSPAFVEFVEELAEYKLSR
ncbi:MAG TPA: hypothetical protein VFC99_12185 [Acidimicrobiia bacterium]|nr:hypothetical protein [Acidimicrobiia bacterium]